MTNWKVTGPVDNINQWPALERFTDRSRRVLELSLKEALQLGHNHVGTEHLLLALIREGEGVAAKVLTDRLQLKLKDVRLAVITELTTTGRDDDPLRPLRDKAEKLAAELKALRAEIEEVAK